MINKVFIRTRPGTDKQITDIMLERVSDSIRQLSDANNMNINIVTQKNQVDDNTLVLALGGDGTMLSAIKIAAEYNSYVAGFNYGHLGYLTHATPKNIASLCLQVQTIIAEINTGEEREFCVHNMLLPMLQAPVTDQGFMTDAVNDVFFVPAASGASARFKVFVDNAQAFETQSSGIVVATPIGSTALALSAGGSIIEPQSKVFQVVPILAHTLTSRPVIVPDNSIITVQWEYEKQINISADGQTISDYYGTSCDVVKKSANIKMVHPAKWNFYDNLQQKLKWST